MKTKDILEELENVKDKYKTESQEENADKLFNRGKGKRIIKYVLSAAALFALAAFIVATVASKYANKNVNTMIAASSGVGYEMTERTLRQETLNPDSSREGSAAVKIEECSLQGGEPAKANAADPDIVMVGGMLSYENMRSYSFEVKEDNRMYFSKTDNGRVLWTYDYDYDLLLYGYKEIGDSLLLISYNFHQWKVTEDAVASLRLVLLDKDGKELWTTSYKNPVGSYTEKVAGVFCDDESIYIASYISEELDKQTLENNVSCASFITSEYSIKTGEQTKRTETPVHLEMTWIQIRCIGKTEIGYFFAYMDRNYKQNIALVKNDGTLVSICSIGTSYEFCSAGYINGKIYLSGSSRSPEYKIYADEQIMIAASRVYWSYAHAYGTRSANYAENGKQTSAYKENMSAVLLVCDEALSPERIYVQKGAFGGKLEKAEKGLCWDVCEIDAALTYKSAEQDDYGTLILAGSSKTYAFDESGKLQSYENTNKSCSMIGDYGYYNPDGSVKDQFKHEEQ